MSSPRITDYQAPASTEELPVSDLASKNLTPPRSTKKRKERRDPSVTPRKFKRFFTPQSYRSAVNPVSRKFLNDITAQPAMNRNTQSSPLRPFRRLVTGQDSSPLGFASRESKRRKVHDMVNQGKEVGYVGPHDGVMSSPCERAVKYSGEMDTECESEDEDDGILPPHGTVKRTVRLEERGLGGQLLRRSIGTNTRQRFAPVNDWRDNTAGFYSKPEDVHTSMSLLPPRQHQPQGARTIPFCVQGLNREDSTLVALADEEGNFRILESAKGGHPPFSKSLFHDLVHKNAIIDMVFSEDDSRLATCSGDQTARVYDMHTKATLNILGTHAASLKQVRWQPGSGNNNILATSSRDGTIQLWDLRCNTSKGATYPFFYPTMYDPADINPTVVFNRHITCIGGAHKTPTRLMPAIGTFDQVVRPDEMVPRTGDVSVTAIQFLPAGREHLLISGSESDASVKLWDMRQNNFKLRPGGALASTTPPQSHSKFRNFGINSLNMSGDGSKFYTLCKDNTVYAYSTEHLMLGQAPELSYTAKTRPPFPHTNRQGLGPLYGFRHPKLHATSFYVKSAIRKARNGKCEMLAVGSSDGSPVLFPTDERYLPTREQLMSPATGTQSSPALLETRPALRRLGSSSSHVDDTLIISTNGTSLERGHEREVSSLTWTASGDLVTVGDDYLVRCWREDRDEAKSLRVGGEQEGRRWGCGWADVEADYDVDDDQVL
ncbi:uncharacterized protein L3040_002347 [Drepanopeziza brunnea f. sp. 'multigermtubi']|uniref:Uncharacterized protein n=1 Tax=Marssonina brunnea f. sp. multigermtubi (strain MB_m1) TaxID=1072389 RepID=K1Y461_MARBU|nr:uncharacterized protein MBM_01926 [Drepanopeziza brunnea f. sp. 'multigermtubi' MB_m1]EKD19974.1 hypothetical protein MBM_01926 [Drepanopeziza brunnea f. sp. 'multigermtubi' MB_m1]KAJ5050464.1 hypothetical protein L3040_002347 [Drepanopeziza brunnea f. sp. 'multigermtubi']